MLRIHLEARRSALNVARVYFISLSQDLFGAWTLKTTYGRMGTQGQDKIYTFDTVEDAFPQIRKILYKRALAPQRSGCQYRLISLTQDPFFPVIDVQTILQQGASLPLKERVTPNKTVSLPLFEH